MLRKVTVRDGGGRPMASIAVFGSGQYVGMDVVAVGPEHGGVAVAFSVQELDELMALFAEVRAEVIAQNR